MPEVIAQQVTPVTETMDASTVEVQQPVRIFLCSLFVRFATPFRNLVVELNRGAKLRTLWLMVTSSRLPSRKWSRRRCTFVVANTRRAIAADVAARRAAAEWVEGCEGTGW